MTPKEKAEELRNNFYQLVADSSYPDELCERCALIAIDEILIVTKWYSCTQAEVTYWEEIKKELQNLN